MAKKNKASSSSSSAQQTVQQLLDKGETEAAWEKIRARLKIKPNDPWFLHEAARYCRRNGLLDDALRYYRRALALQPRDAGLLNGLGLTCFDQGNFEEAEKYYRQTLSLITGYTACHNNYALMLHKLDRHQEALEQYEQVLKYDPDYMHARYGYASVLAHLGELDAAVAQLRRLLQQVPDDTRGQTALGMVLMQKGEFEEGWRLYKGRYAESNPLRFVTLPQINRPFWQGESLEGKSILVFPEQGFGDSLQFCRYVMRLKEEKGVRSVTMVCRPQLLSLLGHLPGVDRVLMQNQLESPAELDYWTTMLNLPLHFLDSENPFGVMPPYLEVDNDRLEKWRLATDAQKPFRIGLIWKGTPKHNNDRHRSLANLSVLKPLWSVPGIQWFSLQKGEGEDEAQNPDADQPITAMGHHVSDFADTAALMTQLDLVITVDTSTAHLAGALGVPCWVMIPCISTDWRWLQGHDDSPWYPSMRLFHRKLGTDWDETVLRIRDALEKTVGSEKK